MTKNVKVVTNKDMSHPFVLMFTPSSYKELGIFVLFTCCSIVMTSAFLMSVG